MLIEAPLLQSISKPAGNFSMFCSMQIVFFYDIKEISCIPAAGIPLGKHVEINHIPSVIFIGVIGEIMPYHKFTDLYTIKHLFPCQTACNPFDVGVLTLTVHLSLYCSVDIHLNSPEKAVSLITPLNGFHYQFCKFLPLLQSKRCNQPLEQLVIHLQH